MAEPLIKIVASDKVVEIKASATRLMFNNFLSGLAWGFGTIVGATVVFALVIFLLSQLNTAPVIGYYVSSIIDYIQSANTR